MRKIIAIVFLITFWSCGNDDEIVIPNFPFVNNITTEPISAGSELIIIGRDLDDNPTVVFNRETITPNSITNTAIAKCCTQFLNILNT